MVVGWCATAVATGHQPAIAVTAHWPHWQRAKHEAHSLRALYLRAQHAHFDLELLLFAHDRWHGRETPAANAAPAGQEVPKFN